MDVENHLIGLHSGMCRLPGMGVGGGALLFNWLGTPSVPRVSSVLNGGACVCHMRCEFKGGKHYKYTGEICCCCCWAECGFGRNVMQEERVILIIISDHIYAALRTGINTHLLACGRIH